MIVLFRIAFIMPRVIMMLFFDCYSYRKQHIFIFLIRDPLRLLPICGEVL